MSLATLRERAKPFLQFKEWYHQTQLYPYFRSIEDSRGPEVMINGQWTISLASNDYLGLAHDPRVTEAAARAARRWGSSTGGSRFLCGNLALFQELEARLAAFVGKKAAVVHTTGFGANLGAISLLLNAQDYVLCDRRSHASILEGSQASRARIAPFRHNDPANAAQRLANMRAKRPEGIPLLITEGIFSMDGDVADLPGLAALKDQEPGLLLYLDDAHGLGVMGPGGRGTAAHFGLTDQVDFIMGTFSKSLASIGGFVASDDEEIMDFLHNQSRTLMFSAALPAPNLAAALKALDIIEAEPQRIERLWEITARARGAIQAMGLDTGVSTSPIIPVIIGDTTRAAQVSRDLLELGVFTLPAIHPAVPKGQELIRIAFMATHSDQQVERTLAALEQVARRRELGPAPTELKETGNSCAGD